MDVNISAGELGNVMKQILDEKTECEELVNSLEMIANYDYSDSEMKEAFPSYLEVWFNHGKKKVVSLILFHLKRFRLTHYMNQ